MSVKSLLVAGAGLACLALLTAAERPRVLAGAGGGSWEITGIPGVEGRRRICVADPAMLAQFEHRSLACTRVVIRDEATSAEVHYTCPGGGFGRSSITGLTPRSLRIETQGISRGAPFHYVLQARRMGNC